MPKLPEPPAHLAFPPIVATLRAGTRLWRIYFLGGAHPGAWNAFRFFGPTHSRFDHHDDPGRVQAKGILYAGRDPTTCLAEVFQATRVIDRGANDPWLVGFELARNAALLDLTGVWPTQAGASMAINSGPRPRARRWSRMIYASYVHLDGILYGSSMHANEDAIALYERAQDAMPAAPIFHRALTDPALRRRIAHAGVGLGYAVV